MCRAQDSASYKVCFANKTSLNYRVTYKIVGQSLAVVPLQPILDFSVGRRVFSVRRRYLEVLTSCLEPGVT